MKRLIIVFIFLVALVAVTPVVSAKAVKLWEDSYRLPLGDSTEIYSKALDENKLKVVKFKDGNTICYVVLGVSMGSSYNPSMECAIK